MRLELNGTSALGSAYLIFLIGSAGSLIVLYTLRLFYVVPGAGIEPARDCSRGIFIPNYSFRCCVSGENAFVVWTLSLPYRV
jgi:hypothetical protein